MNTLPLEKKKIDRLVKEARHYNVAPIFLERYVPLQKKKHPISFILDDLINEAFTYLKIATDQEIKSLFESMPSGFAMLIGPIPEWGDDDKKKRMALCYIIYEVHKRYFTFKDVVNHENIESKVLKVYPELESKFDKDGLLILDDNFKIFDGAIEYKDHVLHYHQLLRRGYTSNPNFDFLGRFAKIYYDTKDKNQFRVAIDHRRIMPKEFYSMIVELDTWFGPPFNAYKLDDPNYVGLTIVKRNKDSLFELTNKLNRTEFYWSFDKNVTKTFEIEEITEIDFKFEHFIFNKYIHSERNIEQKKFVHLDGAVKVYLEDSYQSRYDQNIPTEPRCYKKIKLWRIDGCIDKISWIDIISFFFKSNEMVIEYFNPEEFIKLFELRIRDFKKWKEIQ